MKHILDRIVKEDKKYAEFMIHSSEFMPGGGPRHQGEEDIIKLFETIEALFKYAYERGFRGYTFDTWEGKRKQDEIK